jgi:hypothetical protein
MAITSGSHPKQLWPGVKKFFGDTYAEKPLRADMLFAEMSSDKSYEEYVEEAGFGLAPVKSEGASIQYDTDSQGYISRIVNVTYGLGAKVTQEAIEDNQYFSVARKKSGKLARSMRQTKENVAANIFNRGFTAAFAGGDGVELLATNHPTVNGTQSNELAVAADMSEASLEELLTQIRLATDTRGLRIQLEGMKLAIPPQLEFIATRIVSSANQSGTANNDVNAMRQLGMLPGGVVVNEYFTDPDAFFIITDATEGLIRQQRRALRLEQDNDFDTSNACMKATERYAFGWADWRGVFGSPGA